MPRTIWTLALVCLLGACRPPAELSNARGEAVSLSQFAGKPLLVNYFAQWCAPCLREMPLLNALHAEGRVQVLALSFDAMTPAELDELARRHDIRVPIMQRNDGGAPLPFPHPGQLPTSYLLDGEGKLVQTLVGELDDARLAALTLPQP
ncbi:TlpA family protein disulfide reductase [Aeromonas bivalvium]|uniref:TlpA family protein disulfide reductase n=1 Tax=Aeromonas bivalvium TaxID=440079 RepID=UPI000DCFCAC5|nr:TlpA disulfide reductase family protein [Aeromonas bivalvium]